MQVGKQLFVPNREIMLEDSLDQHRIIHKLGGCNIKILSVDFAGSNKGVHHAWVGQELVFDVDNKAI